MRFIDKKNPEYRARGLRINRQILNFCWDGTRYVNLRYDTVNKSELTQCLLEEQDGRCCYCMRRLHLQDESNHRRNVTLEHVIPHKISLEDWNRDRHKYRAFSKLGDRDVAVCPNGNVADPTRKFGMPPFPHFLAYDNLVASCDGQTLNEERQTIPRHCCNNERGNDYVDPVYFHQNVADEIAYDGRGHIVCDEDYVPYLNEEGVNIMSWFLNTVRLFWNKIAVSEYTKEQIGEAEENENLRYDIVDDVFTYDPEGRWLFLKDKQAWCMFSDYDWFYDYYS